jgi:hypothetical protein
MLAKNLRSPRGVRQPVSSFTTIASRLAPTGLAYTRKMAGVPIPVGAAEGCDLLIFY